MPRFKSVMPMLKTRNLFRTIDFYVSVLGFEVDTLRPDDDPTCCILSRDGINLSFVEDDTLWPGDSAMTGQVWIDVSSLERLFAAIQDRVEILRGPEVYSYGRREFSCKDPNGYALVFSEPADTASTS